jgi:hypothetical protein
MFLNWMKRSIYLSVYIVTMSVPAGRTKRALGSAVVSFQKMATTQVKALPPLHGRRLNRLLMIGILLCILATATVIFGIVQKDKGITYTGFIFMCFILLGFVFQKC